MKKLLRDYGIRDTNLLKDKQMIMVNDEQLCSVKQTRNPKFIKLKKKKHAIKARLKQLKHSSV